MKWNLTTTAWFVCLLGAAWCAGQEPSYLRAGTGYPSIPLVAFQTSRWPPARVLPPPAPNADGTSPDDALTLPVPDDEPLPGESLSVPSYERVQGPPNKPAPKRWEGNIELGVNGTDGNSETLNIRSVVKVKHKTEANELKTEIEYRRTSANQSETANRGQGDFRWEHFFYDSPWTNFSHSVLEYDEFQAWNARLGLDAGWGYRIINAEHTNLIGRLGAGTSRKFGGDDLEWKPESVFGAELERNLTSRQKISLSTDFRPAFDDWEDYHAVTKAGWQAMLDDASHMSLKFSATDRYNSKPQGRKPNDVDYGITLLWAF